MFTQILIHKPKVNYLISRKQQYVIGSKKIFLFWRACHLLLVAQMLSSEPRQSMPNGRGSFFWTRFVQEGGVVVIAEDRGEGAVLC